MSRGIVRVDAGEDLLESLQALAKVAGWHEAFVTGAGVLELVELRVGDDVLTLENAELTSLAGHIRRRDDGPEIALRATVMVGREAKSGHIAAAMTGGLLLVVDAIVDDDGSARPARPAKKRDTTPSPAASLRARDGSQSASKPLSQSFKTKPVVHKPPPINLGRDDEDAVENPIVNAGDYLQHPQLGLCEVVGDDDSGGTRIRVSSGKIRVLKLEHLRVLPGEWDDDGRNVFTVKGPRRR